MNWRAPLLEDKVALITGSGSGQGRAAAEAFAAHGASIAVIDIDDAGAHETVERIRAAGGAAIAVHADVSQRAQCDKMVQAAVDQWGRLDVLYNNAAVQMSGSVTACTEDQWNLTIATNLSAIFWACRAALPYMLERGGSIINTASTLGLIGSDGFAAYGSAKAGLVALTRSIAVEYAPKVRANVIAPGFDRYAALPQGGGGYARRRSVHGGPAAQHPAEATRPGRGRGRGRALPRVGSLGVYLGLRRTRRWRTGGAAMSQRFANRSALVTGGASGLGEAIALRLGAEGARVAVVDIDEVGAKRVADAIRTAGGSATAIAADVTREADVRRAVEATAALGPLHALVLSAAVEHRASLLETSDADWQRVLDVNLKGPWLCMKHAIPRMPAGSAIVALGSTLGLIASPGYPAYIASKGALANLCKLAAADAAAAGVRINLVAPSATDTGLFMRVSQRAPDPEALRDQIAAASPLKRLGRGAEVVETVLFLLGDGAGYVSGAVVPVDGGLAMRRSWMG